MPRRKKEDSSVESFETPLINETEGKKATLYLIVKGMMILRDEDGNAFRIPFSNKYKNKKIGDEIVL